MRTNRKWIIAAIVLVLIATAIWFAGRYTIRLPYFLSGSMEKYLLNLPEGENAQNAILLHCEETSTGVIGETEYKEYSWDEAALQSLLPAGGTVHQVESSHNEAYSAVYLTYKLQGCDGSPDL